MKIEKQKITEESKWNAATKKGLAALIGLAAASTMVACSGGDVAVSGDVENPEVENVEPSSGDPGDPVDSNNDSLKEEIKPVDLAGSIALPDENDF